MSQTLRMSLWLLGGWWEEEWEGMVKGFGMAMYTLLY